MYCIATCRRSCRFTSQSKRRLRTSPRRSRPFTLDLFLITLSSDHVHSDATARVRDTELRNQSRQLENDIESKLLSFK